MLTVSLYHIVVLFIIVTGLTFGESFALDPIPYRMWLEEGHCREYNSWLKNPSDENRQYGKICNLIYADMVEKMTREWEQSNSHFTQKLLSPLDQMQQGILPENIKCSSDFVLIVKLDGDSSACVTPTTQQTLIERGWGFLP